MNISFNVSLGVSFSPTQKILFGVGLLLKIAFLGFIHQSYLTKFFIPFIDSSILNLGENPWKLLPPEYFPYGSFLYVLLFIPKFLLFKIFGSAALGSTFISVFAIKSQILVFDFMLFYVLMKIAKHHGPSLVIWYWLNPILFFINYIVGQLDVFSMALLFCSLLLLLKKKLNWSAAIFALAVACKFHVIAVLPLLMAYIWNRNFLKEAVFSIARWVGIVVGIVAVGLIPIVMANHGDYVTFSSPEAFRLFGLRLVLGGNVYLLVGVLIVLFVLCRLLISHLILTEGLVYGVGLVFGSILISTYTAASWYYWFVPFVGLFYSCFPRTHKMMQLGLSFLYLVYFMVFDENTRFFVVNHELFRSLIFTVMQLAVFAILIEMWVVIVQKSFPIFGRLKPFVVGIGGDSGSGKDTLAKLLSDTFNAGRSLVVEGDSYHKWARGDEKWQSYTHLSPKANDLTQMAEHAEKLVGGSAIVHPHYDHETGKFTLPKQVTPKKFMILQGLHTLYLKKIRQLIDLKIFLDPDPELRMEWKIKRDVHERGHDIEKVKKSIQNREADGKKFIDPQRHHADWIMSHYPGSAQNQVRAISCVKHTFSSDFPVERLAESFLNLFQNFLVVMNFDENNPDLLTMRLEGDPSQQEILKCVEHLFPSLRQITKGYFPPVWAEGMAGVTQIIAVAMVDVKIRGLQCN